MTVNRSAELYQATKRPTLSVEADVPIRIGISSCLMGQQVRFDGGHKRDPFLVDTVGRYVEWVTVCPEVDAGFGTPRESMRLSSASGAVRLVTGANSGIGRAAATALARGGGDVWPAPATRMGADALQRRHPPV